ncbi:thiamine phosphate synthase [Dysgonomonas sp. Marseille-P4677]|uniref:thiamine phosphate synthase n=1 Tax=Dysgonomonas sp. Marseille-P4677 TaxID=2364790 RepID=UPI001911DD8B|nr:thiamine phosphate synthase [Dysgonomonas sp. Marseille-P4677]MBK5720637.1 thiamine phosphate synthase [Dysgonomonas sp. Marseille-P4677]
MKLIVITNERILDYEGSILSNLFDEGLETLHLRKLIATEGEIIHLIEQIPVKYHKRIVLHDHYNILKYFDLNGIHLNRRNPIPPSIEVASVSRSCHSFECIKASMNNHNYMFLSPIFDSISKSGYNHAFTKEELLEAKLNCIINKKVIALGGICKETIPIASEYGFGGVAVLGAIWGNYYQDRDENALLRRFSDLSKIVSKL